jgi:hypothetical protein
MPGDSPILITIYGGAGENLEVRTVWTRASMFRRQRQYRVVLSRDCLRVEVRTRRWLGTSRWAPRARLTSNDSPAFAGTDAETRFFAAALIAAHEVVVADG